MSMLGRDRKVFLDLVHCYAGISRSGVVGLWATRYLELNEELSGENYEMNLESKGITAS
jgi:predicted protein tyrosine phosphatase